MHKAVRGVLCTPRYRHVSALSGAGVLALPGGYHGPDPLLIAGIPLFRVNLGVVAVRFVERAPLVPPLLKTDDRQDDGAHKDAQ